MAPDASPNTDQLPATDHGQRARRAIAAALTVLGVVTASLVIGRVSAPIDRDPIDSSAEAGFARDMQVHHLQAVELAMIVRDTTSDPDVRLLAYDIATSQAQQSGQMFGWLAEWGLSQAATDPAMTWMSRPTLDATNQNHAANHRPGSAMPGLASREQLSELTRLQGVAAERLFLALMIAHHEGGVEMAQAIIERSTNRVVTNLASGIVQSQASETILMRGMLTARH